MSEKSQMELALETIRNNREVRCSVCKRVLTNAKSRHVGIGPDCYSGRASHGYQRSEKSIDPPTINSRLIEQVRLLAKLIVKSLDPDDVVEVEIIVKKVTSLNGMAAISVHGDIHRLLGFYGKSGMRRDDIMSALESLVRITGEVIGA